MRTSQSHVRQFILLLSVCFISIGCSTASYHPWIENGERVGRIWKSKTRYGAECLYYNTAGQLLRYEKHDQNDNLLPGSLATVYAYSPSGDLVGETTVDAQNTPAVCAAGYVYKKYSYHVSDDGGRITVGMFLDREHKAICTTNGYAVVRLIYDPMTFKVKEVVLENDRYEPASGLWNGVAGVARVKYAVLEGIGDIRVGVYYGPSGTVVGRKQVEGKCFYINSY